MGVGEVKIVGNWADQWEPSPTPHELELDEDARTGRPRDFVVDLDTVQYYAQVRVIRRGRGEYDFQPLSKLRKRLARPPNADPKRLPA